MLLKNNINRIQKLLLIGFIFLNLCLIFFIFKNHTLSRIFNLRNLENLSKINYHYQIFFTALYFSFFLFCINFFNFLKDKEGGESEKLFHLILKLTELKYCDEIYNFKDYIDVCQKSDNNFLKKIILLDESRKKIFCDKNKKNKFLKNLLKLNAFKFVFIFLKFFIFFEIFFGNLFFRSNEKYIFASNKFF
jgi:hypothetical protein